MNAPLQRLIRFGLAGAVSTVCYFVLATGFFWLMPGHGVASSVIAYCLCIALSFLLQRNFTFRADGAFHFEFPRFTVSSLLGLLLSTLIVQVGLSMGLSAIVCYLIVALVVAPLSYLLMARFVFPTQSEKT